MRMYALAKDGEVMPKSMVGQLDGMPNFSKWAKAILAHKNATRIFDEEKFVEATRLRMQKMQADKK